MNIKTSKPSRFPKRGLGSNWAHDFANICQSGTVLARDDVACCTSGAISVQIHRNPCRQDSWLKRQMANCTDCPERVAGQPISVLQSGVPRAGNPRISEDARWAGGGEKKLAKCPEKAGHN